MLHTYNEVYLNSVMHNLAVLFDIAINALGMNADSFAYQFVNSKIAHGIEAEVPNYLVGKSAIEMLMLILDEEVDYISVPVDSTKEN